MDFMDFALDSIDVALDFIGLALDCIDLKASDPSACAKGGPW